MRLLALPLFALFAASASILILPPPALAQRFERDGDRFERDGDRFEHRGERFERREFRGGEFRLPGVVVRPGGGWHERRWWHGRWWPYGVGSCWRLAPDGEYVWICD